MDAVVITLTFAIARSRDDMISVSGAGSRLKVRTSGEVRIGQRSIVQEFIQIPFMGDGSQVFGFLSVLEGFAIDLGLLCFTVDDGPSQTVRALFRPCRLEKEQ